MYALQIQNIKRNVAKKHDISALNQKVAELEHDNAEELTDTDKKENLKKDTTTEISAAINASTTINNSDL
jgi:ribosomal protein L9